MAGGPPTFSRVWTTEAPTPQKVGTRRFANEAYNGEMCINFGNVVGGSLGPPGEAGGTVPDFAKVTRGEAPGK
jgi:hypothetical protein